MFDASTYAVRRRSLLQRMDSGVLLLLGNRESPVNYPGNPYPFRQDSAFAYYCGVDAPGYDAILDVEAGTTTLYGDAPSLDAVVWTGPQPTPEARAEAAHIEHVASSEDLAADLDAALRAGRRVHVLPPYRDTHRLRLQSLLGLTVDRLEAYVSRLFVDAVVAQRSIKSREEVAELETALNITATLHTDAMRAAAPGVTEQDLVGRLMGTAHAHGGRLSFPPICSVRGEVLHNHNYTNTLSEGDVLLLDAGATAPSLYAGDITRVTPVGGTFSDRQQAVYRAVLDAQETALDAIAPGVPFRDLHLLAARVLTDHLQTLGLMRGDAETSVEAGAHALFFPHGLGHMMGLDVHDMEGLGEDRVGYAPDQDRSDQFGLRALRLARPLQAGFVVTVEPGLYFIPDLIRRWKAEDRHAAFINYAAIDDFMNVGGVRIEDDVLVTDDGPQVLGPGIPKTPEAVEALAGVDAAVV
jgi:Xaa-Pro aminopeptidase